MDINRNNCESYFLLYLDRELNAADREAVENFLNENADLEKEFNLLQKTIQWPSETIFEQKESLYRREEKRRFIPVYWLRMAAVFTLILAGGWFMKTALKNQKNMISTGEQKLATLDSKKNPEASGAERKERLEKPVQSGHQAIMGIAENGRPGKTIFQGKKQGQNGIKDQVKIYGDQPINNQDIRNGEIKQAGDEQKNSIPDEALMVLPRSNAALELLASGDRNGPINPGPVHMPTGAQTPVLQMAVASPRYTPGNDNSRDQEVQTENAISVIALNDRNKAIAGFFKKLTSHAPADETANNNKKLRVSVFQFSY